jgi:hypothetical protein
MAIPLLYPEASHRVWLYVFASGVVLILSSVVFLVRLHRESVKGLPTALRRHFWRRTGESRSLSYTDEELGSGLAPVPWRGESLGLGDVI